MDPRLIHILNSQKYQKMPFWTEMKKCAQDANQVNSSVSTFGKIIPIGLKRKSITYHWIPQMTLDAFSRARSARTVMSVLTGASQRLVIDCAFCIESQHPAELPERVLGGFRIHHLDTERFRPLFPAKDLLSENPYRLGPLLLGSDKWFITFLQKSQRS